MPRRDNRRGRDVAKAMLLSTPLDKVEAIVGRLDVA
jgi:hypothetical protein